MKEVVFAGAGGQGVLTAGLILGQIAVFKGWKATWIPQYGSAMRGGTANCTVKFGEGVVYNPSQEEPDILLAMNTPSLNKFSPIVRSGGLIIYNADMVTLPDTLREDVTYVGIPCVTLANRIQFAKGANIVMMGAITEALSEFTREEGLDGMLDMFRKKGKEKYEAINKEAFAVGYDYMKRSWHSEHS